MLILVSNIHSLTLAQEFGARSSNRTTAAKPASSKSTNRSADGWHVSNGSARARFINEDTDAPAPEKPTVSTSVRQSKPNVEDDERADVVEPKEIKVSAGTGWRLKWRETHIATGHSSDRPVSASMQARSKRTSGVATVGYEEEVSGGPSLGSASTSRHKGNARDPFSDPFGDKNAKPTFVEFSGDNVEATEKAPAPQKLPAVLTASVEDETVPGPPPRGLSAPSNSSGGVEDPNPSSDSEESDIVPQTKRKLGKQDSDPAPGKVPQVPDDDTPPVPPTPDDGTGDAEPPCDRTYNERNCCGEDAKCENARKTLKAGSIRDISLDITPSIKPDAKTKEETEGFKVKTLASAPSRTWKNRNGEVIAVGRLRDLRHNRAVVESDDGQFHEFPMLTLGDDDRCFVAAWWGLPTTCLFADSGDTNRSWIPTELNWKASALCHKPLYFEEVQLERYGHTVGPVFEPYVSGAHFFMNVAFLPYNMAINPPSECQYALGYYRPGSCAPWLVPPVPISLRAAVVEAGLITGGVFIIP